MGGRLISRGRSHSFWSCLNNCNLIDLGFKESRYTWSNHRRRRKGLILKHLDRCHANEIWLQQYPNATVTHLPKVHSDHNPLLINTSTTIFRPTKKPFKLQSFWCSHPDFHNIVQQSWLQNDLPQATATF